MNSVVMIVRTYFKTYTYCSTSVIVDGEFIGKAASAPGTYSQGIFHGMELLKSKGYLEDWIGDNRGYMETAERHFSSRGVKFYSEEIAVKSSKEL